MKGCEPARDPWAPSQPWAGHRQQVHTMKQPDPPLQAAQPVMPQKNKESGN